MKNIAIILVGVCSLSCDQPTEPQKDAVNTAPSSDFRWVAVRPASAAEPETHPARILWTGASQGVVSVPLPARVIDVAVKPGDQVQRGDPIVTVVMPQLDAAVAAAEAARLSLVVLQKRQEQLASLQSQGLVRGAELARLQLDIAEFKAERLKSLAVTQGAGFKTGGRVQLRSPMTGVVTDVDGVVGQLRQPDDRPLARIQSPHGQRVEANLTAKPPTDGNYVLSTALGDVPLSLISFAPKLGAVGYRVWLEPREQVALPAVSEGLLRVGLDVSADTWLLPAASVGRDTDGAFVIVLPTRAAQPKRVAVSVSHSGPGTVIVQAKLSDEMHVAMDPAAASSLLAEPTP